MSDKEFRSTGYPQKRGIYRCRVDGKEMWLSHRMCDLNGKHWWMTVSGHDVVGCKIEWSDEMLKIN